MRAPGRELLELLGDVLPEDHAGQTLAEHYIERQLGRRPGEPWRVLDLGCGAGDSVELFRSQDPQVQWQGADVPGSREASGPRRSDAAFVSFDGVSLPFPAQSFDLVYCKQVLEHVRRPQPLLAEVRRVLAPAGFLAGSTSQLEPFHSLSVWNYTPVGLRLLLAEAGLELRELRPGIDGPTLIARRLVGQGHLAGALWRRWWGGQSPLHRVIDLYGRAAGLPVSGVIATKLLFSGQFTFLAGRAEATAEAAPAVVAKRGSRR